MKKTTIFFLSALTILISCSNKKETHTPATAQGPGDIDFTEKGFANIFISEEYLNSSIGRFENNIHFFNNKLSKSIWFDSAAICFLADYIRKPENANRYDGFRIFLIQYDRMNPEGYRVRGQFHPNQTSIAISPTINHIADIRKKVSIMIRMFFIGLRLFLNTYLTSCAGPLPCTLYPCHYSNAGSTLPACGG